MPPKTHIPYNTDKVIPAHDTYSYWLYASSNMGGYGGSAGRGAASKASCFGAVVFKDHNNTLPVDTTDPKSGWTIVFSKDGYAKGGGNNTTPLYFDHGQFVDEKTDLPGIALQGCWALKGTFTGKPADITMWPILVGTIGGTQVIGVPMRPEDGWDKFANYWQKFTFNTVLHNFLLIMGVVMAIDFIKQKLWGKSKKTKEIKENENEGKDLTPDQQTEVNNYGEIARTEAQTRQEGLARRVGTDPVTGENVQVPDESSLPQAQGAVKEVQIDSANARTADNYGASANEIQGNVDKLIEISDTPSLESAQDNIDDVWDKLPDSVKNGDFSSVKPKLKGARSSVKDAVETIGNEVAEETKAAIETSQTLQTALEESGESSEGEKDTVDDDGTPDADGYEPDIDVFAE